MQKILLAIMSAAALCAIVTITPVRGQVDSATYVLASHRNLLSQWLKTRPGLRLATERDCANREGLSATRQENGASYQPYYAVGDFNRDGQPDFAVALISENRRSRRFAVAIFNGPFTASRSNTPNFLADGIDLSDGGLVWLSGNRLLAGVFQSDDCVRFIARGKTYLMKSCV